ncbi:TBC1 domain family member 17-like [Varroa destructor]|uniref:TBC1 domain family member 15 n=1 Tax=Varroa destructor TaxID=109461 RepID=A0A7M7K1W6_VARDE|nr:TBC1 domain family member 17-like [Varroa destructor]
MATAGPIGIPSGEILFDQNNVRSKHEGSHRTRVYNGYLQIQRTANGQAIIWKPKDTVAVARNGAEASGPVHYNGSGYNDSVVIGLEKGEDEVHIEEQPQGFFFYLQDMRSYHLSQRKNSIEMMVMLCDGARLPTLVFDVGKQQLFLAQLESEIQTRVSAKDKRLHIVVQEDADALQKSFDSLDLFQLDGGNRTLVSRFVRDPLPTFADGLAKVTHFFTQGQYQYTSRHISEAMLDLKPESVGTFRESFTIDADQEPGFNIVEPIPKLPPRINVTRSASLGLDEWATYFDIAGRIFDPNNLRERIFRGGCSPEIRPEAWKFLLGVYDFSKTAKEREAEHGKLTERYYRMKLQWKSMSPEQEARFAAFTLRKNLVEKDVNRTDRSVDIFARDGNEYLSMLSDVLMTYIMYDFDLGYVQGMSDLLSPILSVMQNEPDAFWCFSKFVSMIRYNFIDHGRMEEKEQQQLGIKRQLIQLHQLLSVATPSFTEYLDNHESGNLYFCFRWLLIWFKREFNFEDTKRLWEVLWTHLPCENFHLLFCVAILEEEQIRIMENNFGLNEILKHINDMCFKITLEDNLIRAEQLYFQLLGVPKAAKNLGFKELGEEVKQVI